MNYYYQKNGESYGPISIDDIVKIIDENTLVSDSSKEWKAAKDIPEILVLLIASGVVKPTIKKVPPPPPPPSPVLKPPPPPSSNIPVSSSSVIPPSITNNTTEPPINKGTDDFNTPPKQYYTGNKNNSKKSNSILQRLIILGVIAALIFYGADLYNEKKQADEREYNKEHGITVVGQGNNTKDDEDVSPSSNSSHNSNEKDASNKNDDPTLGIVGHKKWCDCAACDKIRDDNGKNGNAMGGGGDVFAKNQERHEREAKERYNQEHQNSSNGSVPDNYSRKSSNQNNDENGIDYFVKDGDIMMNKGNSTYTFLRDNSIIDFVQGNLNGKNVIIYWKSNREANICYLWENGEWSSQERFDCQCNESDKQGISKIKFIDEQTLIISCVNGNRYKKIISRNGGGEESNY